MPKIESLLSPLPRHSPYSDNNNSAAASTSGKYHQTRTISDDAIAAQHASSDAPRRSSPPQSSTSQHSVSASDPSDPHRPSQERRTSYPPPHPEVTETSFQPSEPHSSSSTSISHQHAYHPRHVYTASSAQHWPPSASDAPGSDTNRISRLTSRVASLEGELSVFRDQLAESYTLSNRLLHAVSDMQRQIGLLQSRQSLQPPLSSLPLSRHSEAAGALDEMRVSSPHQPPSIAFRRDHGDYSRRPFSTHGYGEAADTAQSHLRTYRDEARIRPVAAPVTQRRSPSPRLARASSSESFDRRGASRAIERQPTSPMRPPSIYSLSSHMDDEDELHNDEDALDRDADQMSLDDESIRGMPAPLVPRRPPRKKTRHSTGTSASPSHSNISLPASTQIHHKMSRKADTIRKLYEEWTVGLDGGPSIESLNAQYGSQWRRHQTDKNFYSQRSECLPWIRSVADALVQHAIPISNGEGGQPGTLRPEQAIEIAIQLADLACRRTAAVAQPGQDPMPGTIAKFNSQIRNEKRVDKNRDVWHSSLLRSIMRREEARTILEGLHFKDNPVEPSAYSGSASASASLTRGSMDSTGSGSVAGSRSSLGNPSDPNVRSKVDPITDTGPTTARDFPTPRSSVMSLSSMTSSGVSSSMDRRSTETKRGLDDSADNVSAKEGRRRYTASSASTPIEDREGASRG